MFKRIDSVRTRGAATYHGWTRLSRRYWWLYILAVVLYEMVLDRVFGWANAKVDETGIALLGYVIGEIVYSPMILVVGVVVGLLIYAFATASNTDTAPSSAVVGRSTLVVSSEGVMWRRSQNGGRAYAYCPEHDLKLLYREFPGRYTVMEPPVESVAGNKQLGAKGSLYCPEDGAEHRVELPSSQSFDEAQQRAGSLIERPRE